MIKNLFLLLGISILFISCIDVESQITLRSDGTGEWTLKYRIAQEVLYLTPGSELSGYNYFPRDIAGVIERADSLPGLLLLDISGSETTEYVEIDARFSFTSTDDIGSFFNNYSENPILIIDSDSKGQFLLTLGNPYLKELDKDTYNILTALYSKSSVNITADLPGIVTGSSRGLLSENPGQAGIEVGIMDLITQDTPFLWVVDYE